MADLPRRLFAGDTGAAGLVLLCYLWSWVSSDAKRRGGPHWVYFTIDRLAEARNVGTRAIDSALCDLQRAGLVRRARHQGNFGCWLMTPAGWEDPNQQPDQALEIVLASPDQRLADRRGGDAAGPLSSGDRRSIDRRSPAGALPDRSGIDDQSRGDLRSIAPRSTIDLVACKEEQGVKQGGSRKSIAAAGIAVRPGKSGQLAAAADLLNRSEARSLLSELAPELDKLGLRLPVAGRCLELLAALLGVVGDAEARAEQRRHVREYVLAFAAICVSHDTRQRRFWVAEMFSTEAMQPGGTSRWAAIEITVEHWQQRIDAEAHAAAQLVRQREAAASEAAAVTSAQLGRPEVQVELARQSESQFGVWLAGDVARRAGVQRERDVAQAEDEELRTRREQQPVLNAAPTDDLDELETRGRSALLGHRAKVVTELARASLEERLDEVAPAQPAAPRDQPAPRPARPAAAAGGRTCVTPDPCSAMSSPGRPCSGGSSGRRSPQRSRRGSAWPGSTNIL
jgi:hypothetical protein